MGIARRYVAVSCGFVAVVSFLFAGATIQNDFLLALSGMSALAVVVTLLTSPRVRAAGLSLRRIYGLIALPFVTGGTALLAGMIWCHVDRSNAVGTAIYTILGTGVAFFIGVLISGFVIAGRMSPNVRAAGPPTSPAQADDGRGSGRNA